MRFFADLTVSKTAAEALLSQQQSTSRSRGRLRRVTIFSDVKERRNTLREGNVPLCIGSLPSNTDYVYSILSITQEKNGVFFRWLIHLASSVLCSESGGSVVVAIQRPRGPGR